MRFFSLRVLRTPDGGRLDAAADSGQGVSLSESPGAGNAAPVFWERFGLLPGRPRAAVLLVCCPGLGVSERRFGNLNQRGGSGRQSLETLPPVAPRQALNSEARSPKQIFGRAPRPAPRQRQALRGGQSFGASGVCPSFSALMFPPGRASRFPGRAWIALGRSPGFPWGDALAVSPRSRLLRPESRRRSRRRHSAPLGRVFPVPSEQGRPRASAFPEPQRRSPSPAAIVPGPPRRQAPESRLETLFPGRPPGGPDAEPCAPKHISGRRRSSGLRGSSRPEPPACVLGPRPTRGSPPRDSASELRTRQNVLRDRISGRRPLGPPLRPEPRPALPASAAPGFLWDRPPARPSRPTFRNRSPHPRSERRSARIPGPRPH